MPGIYGFSIIDDSVGSDEIRTLFHSMGESVHHRSDYISKENMNENFVIGKKCFPYDPEINHAVQEVDGTYIVFVDGAIFSFEDEKGKHEVTDLNEFVKTLIRQYQKYGTLKMDRVNGEFVIGLYDKKCKVLVLANDRWGMRELFYYIDKSICIFSSEAKAILKYSGFRTKINEEAVVDFLSFGYLLGNKTFFEGIHLLPPGSTMVVDDKKHAISFQKYTLNPTLSGNDFDVYVDTAYKLLDRSIVNRIRGRKKIASYLSGGLDSRIVTGILSQHASNVDTFTISQHDHGKEYLVAQEVMKKLKNCTNSMGKTSPDHIRQHLSWAIWMTEGMMYLRAVSPFYGATHNDLKDHDILLGGFAGDLVLGGLFMSEERIRNTYTAQERIDIMGNISETGVLKPFLPILIHDDFRERFTSLYKKSLQEQYDYIADKTDVVVFQFDLFVMMGRYRRGYNANRGLIGHVTVEEFYPLIDIDLFDFMYSLPPETRLNYKLYKAIYKKYFPELAEIVWLYTGKSLMNDKTSWLEKQRKDILFKLKWFLETRSRGKINIPDRKNYANHAYWYRTNKHLQSYIDEILLDPRTFNRGYLTEKGIRSVLEKTKVGWDFFPLIDRMVILELWCRIYLDSNGVI